MVRTGLIIIGLLLASTSSVSAHPIVFDRASPELTPDPAMPSHLRPYVNDEGVFDPGDFAWMRGRFAGDSEADKARYALVSTWLDNCSDEEEKAVVAQLEAMGVKTVDANRFFATTPFCAQFAMQPPSDAFATFEEFESHLISVLPIFHALIYTIKEAEHRAYFRDDSLKEALFNVTLGEQLVRTSFRWIGNTPPPGTPKLTEKQKPVFSALLAHEMARLDRRNTAWLKEKVANSGWPTFSAVGEYASRKAWLLAQHADHDPVWQLKVFRMMEALVVKKEVSPKDYAYLYDRVMLKLSGKQRHATQVTCENGERVPRPLENPQRMDEIRAEVGLGSFADYVKGISGSC